MARGRLGTSASHLRRASGRAARRPGSSDPEPSAARARMSRRGRLGRRGAAGRRRTGPAEINVASWDDMMADLEADMQRRANVHRTCLADMCDGT